MKAENAERQEMFGKQLLEHVPLIAYICHGLEQDKSGDLPEDCSSSCCASRSAKKRPSALRVAIEWGRYGDLFEYNFNTGVIQRSEETRKKRIKAWRTRARGGDGFVDHRVRVLRRDEARLERRRREVHAFIQHVVEGR
jgi:hypothetical protein